MSDKVEKVVDEAVTKTQNVTDAGRTATTNNVDADCLFVIKIVLAFIFPPLAVGLDRGCGCELVLNIVLTILGYIPGVVHAFFVILRCGSSDADLEVGQATVTATTSVAK